MAANLRLPPSVISALALVLGLLHGLLNGATMGVASAGLGALFGIAATVFVVESLVAATVVAFTWQPARIARAGELDGRDRYPGPRMVAAVASLAPAGRNLEPDQFCLELTCFTYADG